MARTRSRSPGRGGPRTAALVLAGAIALASTAVVVRSDDPGLLRLAVVGALWAFVLAAFAAPRRGEPAAAPAAPGTDLELRRTYEIELEREVAARREYELQLEVYLRRELERGLAEDVQALRDEVGRMRGEMLDRLDGELRMERIETTRLIGGSLRALQDEARRLGIGLPVPAELTAYEEPAAYQPAAYQSAARQPAAQPSAAPQSAPYQPAASQSAAYQSAPHQPAAQPPAPRAAEPAPATRWDPLTDAIPAHPPAPAARVGPAGPLPPLPRAPVAGEQVPPPRTQPDAPRRRRARADGEDNEVMSRLLGR